MAVPHLLFGVAATLGIFWHSPMPPLLQALKTYAVASLWTKYLQVPFNCRLSLPSHLPLPKSRPHRANTAELMLAQHIAVQHDVEQRDTKQNDHLILMAYHISRYLKFPRVAAFYVVCSLDS